MELENIILSKVRQAQRSKVTYSPSYVDYRPTTNAVILLDMGHTLTGECPGRLGKEKETYNLNLVDVLTVEERI
jgi:hypothetical protein